MKFILMLCSRTYFNLSCSIWSLVRLGAQGLNISQYLPVQQEPADIRLVCAAVFLKTSNLQVLTSVIWGEVRTQKDSGVESLCWYGDLGWMCVQDLRIVLAYNFLCTISNHWISVGRDSVWCSSFWAGQIMRNQEPMNDAFVSFPYHHRWRCGVSMSVKDQ